MNKNIIISLIILFAVLFATTHPVHAQMGSMMNDENTAEQTADETDMHTESVEAILQNILNQQKVSTIQNLDLDKISDDDWERLGDAVMELQHPGQAHEVMDQMMGGEGSESLRQMHINMGKAYLGNDGNYYGSGMMGRGNMMNMGFGSMMGYRNGATAGYGIFAGLTWIALMAFLVSGIYFFIRQAKKK